MRTPTQRLLALIIAALVACGPDTDIGPPQVTLAVSPSIDSLVVGDTVRLAAIGADPQGITFIAPHTVWSSDNPAVAAVDANGLVTAVALGTATVSALAGGQLATATVTVTPAAVIATSVDSVGFTALGNGPTPAGQVVAITNAGGGTLTSVRDSVVYGPGASGWLNATLSGTIAPDTLNLGVSTTAFTLGTYTATVTLKASKAAPKVVQVTLTLSAGPPTQLTRAAGDSQSAIAGSAVPIAPAVRVRDALGNPVSAVEVQFAVTAGGGSLGRLVDTTDAAGTASPGTWTLGTIAGTNHFTATVATLPVLEFTAFAVPGNAVNLVKVSGDSQTDTVAATLATLYTVRVTDGSGNGVAGVVVGWAAPPGSGSVIPTAPQTDANGFATATRKLGTAAGTDTTTAAVGGLVGSPITFIAHANPGNAATIAASVGDQQIATVDSAVAVPPAVVVHDGFGNPVAGVAITFSVALSNGVITGPTPTTNASGIATVGSWTLGTGRRTDTLSAAPTSATLSGSPVRFTARAAWSLQRHVQPQVLSLFCAGCHTAGPSPSMRSDTASYQSLLNGNGTATIYVTPFDTTDDGLTKTHGFLLFRLKSTTSPMPPGGTPLSVSNPGLYALIRDWILDGARR